MNNIKIKVSHFESLALIILVLEPYIVIRRERNSISFKIGRVSTILPVNTVFFFRKMYENKIPIVDEIYYRKIIIIEKLLSKL